MSTSICTPNYITSLVTNNFSAFKKNIRQTKEYASKILTKIWTKIKEFWTIIKKIFSTQKYSHVEEENNSKTAKSNNDLEIKTDIIYKNSVDNIKNEYFNPEGNFSTNTEEKFPTFPTFSTIYFNE